MYRSHLSLYLTRTCQRIDGFGFSLACQRANLITNLSDKTKQRELLDLLFNRTTGAGFPILRNGIGSTPNSNSDYMNTIAPDNPGGPNAQPQPMPTASRLAAYIKLYMQEGMNITHLGFLNEPDYSANYARMQANGQQAVDFFKIPHTTFEREGLTSQVGITCCNSMGRQNQVNMHNAIRSGGAEQYLRAVTSHLYTDSPFAPMTANPPVWLSGQCDLQGT
ncbi:uncharacterized protein CTHT_0024030 [Thermochaetoides thermophila DSM 1495]|uniref:Glycoside hydrolase family 30 protein n=1 Tax=Chaetomium thermophilum (strain DSM 1495 / CBS 144.50 / IMI 039719) TaxID=759272 RepID=G0S544_CHATD|nr:hypothetical protein CTHT_0024030 [Thermochaetoides thermophila DSM 1495]EGS20569.1 hypothetical protein CTHT_0024030 [Thermochaetoides thermophila DSM 1495]